MDRYGHASDWSEEPPELSERELLQGAASFSPDTEVELRRLKWADAEAKANARHDGELLEFIAAIFGKPENEPCVLLQKEAEERELQGRMQRPIKGE